MIRWATRLATLCLMLASPGCTQTRTNQPPSSSAYAAHQKYFPPSLQPLHFSMPLEEFAKARNLSQLQRSDSMSFRIEFSEATSADALKTVTYYFDKNLPGQPLYEMILEFDSERSAQNFTATTLGPANSGTEWLFEVGLGAPFKAWAFDSKVVLILAMKGTEYAN